MKALSILGGMAIMLTILGLALVSLIATYDLFFSYFELNAFIALVMMFSLMIFFPYLIGVTGLLGLVMVHDFSILFSLALTMPHILVFLAMVFFGGLVGAKEAIAKRIKS